MQVLYRALNFLGIRAGKGDSGLPDYQESMRQALDRMAAAQRMIQEAVTLEQLDLARSDIAAAQAQLQQVIRQAKRDRGIALRPISETEEIHRRIRESINTPEPARASKRGRGAG